MEFIDERGRLFGLVNVIDALVVLLVLAVLVAGLALVYPPGAGGEPASRYATVELAQQPAYVADRISAGDRMVTRAGNVTVTDVYVTDAETDTTVVARVEVNGTLVEREDRSGRAFVYDEEPLRAGRRLDINTTEYTARGIVTNVSTEGRSLPTERTSVRIQTTVPTATVDAISTGDTYAVAGDTIATVESVQTFPTNRSDRRLVTLGVTMETIRQSGVRTFAGRPTTVGASVPVRTDSYDLNGTIVATGTLARPGQATTTTAVVEIENVPPAVADEIDAGDTEIIRDRRLARVESVRSDNATVILTSESGEIFAREHPRNRDVTMTVALETRRTPDGLRFHGRPLEVGSDVVLELDGMTVSGRVTRLQG